MTHSSADQMWLKALHDVMSGERTSSRDGDTLEVIGWCGEITDPYRCLVMNPARRLSPFYAAAEVLWYLSGSDDGTFMAKFAPQYSRFLDEDGKTANGAYGSRLLKDGHDQLQSVVDLLRKDPDSRQAVIQMWNHRDLKHAAYGSPKDVPCTTGAQFLIRGGKLVMITTMRSNDVWLGMPYDVFWFCTLQIILARTLGVGVGSYHHRVGSLHLYDRDYDKARAVDWYDELYVAWKAESAELLEDVRLAASYAVCGECSAFIEGGMSEALVSLCRAVLHKDTPNRYKLSPALRELYDRTRRS